MSNGDVYEGEYHLDKKHGYGKFVSEVEGTYEVISTLFGYPSHSRFACSRVFGGLEKSTERPTSHIPMEMCTKARCATICDMALESFILATGMCTKGTGRITRSMDSQYFFVRINPLSYMVISLLSCMPVELLLVLMAIILMTVSGSWG